MLEYFLSLLTWKHLALNKLSSSFLSYQFAFGNITGKFRLPYPRKIKSSYQHNLLWGSSSVIKMGESLNIFLHSVKYITFATLPQPLWFLINSFLLWHHTRQTALCTKCVLPSLKHLVFHFFELLFSVFFIVTYCHLKTIFNYNDEKANV